MKKKPLGVFILLFCSALLVAQDDMQSDISGRYGPTVSMAPGESKDFTENFVETLHTAYSLTLLGVTGADANLVEVTLNSWNQTASLITVRITVTLDASAIPGSQLSFAIRYRYYFAGGYATVTSSWIINVISSLPPPQIAVSPGSCYEYIPPGDSIDIQLALENIAPQGSADLEWQASTVFGTFGDLIAQYDVSAVTGSERCVGVEYAFGYLWVTSGNTPNTLAQIDVSGTDPVLVGSYDQGTTSSWGWRDLASDGTYLYASDSDVIVQIDPATGSSTGTSIPGPINPNRALAYDPITDHFWTMSYSSSLYEIDRNGTLINTFTNPISSYGSGWDTTSADGPFLWLSAGTSSGDTYTIHQVNPSTGALTGLNLTGTAGTIAGGLDIEDQMIPGRLVAVALGQGTADIVDVWDITPSQKAAEMLSPTSGVLAPGQTVHLTIRLFGLQPDTTFEGSVTITSNDPAHPTVSIPVVVSTVVGIEELGEMPSIFAISNNYPNPFNPTTTIHYELPKACDVKLTVYDVLGRPVRALVDESKRPGRYKVVWDGRNEDGNQASSGVYIYRMIVGDFMAVKKMTLLK